MCYRYDITRTSSPIGCPSLFTTYNQALQHAREEAIITEPWYCENLDMIMPRCQWHVKIFEIPFGRDVYIQHENSDPHNYDLYEDCIMTVYDTKTTAAMIIQRKWRTIYNTRFAAAAIIRKHIKRAIVNPSTPLCRNRLLREFYLMDDF